jgi:hypothetical protein
MKLEPFAVIITDARCGTSHRGPVLILTLAGVGVVEVTPRDLLRSKRFCKAVFRQTGHVLEPMANSAWQAWLSECVQQARRAQC